MNKMRPLSLLIFTVSAVALAACTSWLGGEELKVTPVSKMTGLTTEPRDALYESAVTAINERDYGRALDYLQEAKARNPGNIKVLNALGVVYDKLGRFDLSARYYAQARAIDPNSTVVAANVTYSNSLQGLTDSRGPVARLDLPENFNPVPAGKPTVLASEPAAIDAIQRPVAAAAPPVAAPAILARTETADSVKPLPKPVVAGPVSVREPKQLAWVAPQLAAAQAEVPPNANMTASSVAAAKPAAEKPAIAVPAPSKLAEAPKIDSVSKPRIVAAIAPTVSAPSTVLAEAPKIDSVSKPRIVAAIAPTVSAPSTVLAEAPKPASVSKPRVAVATTPIASVPGKLEVETPKIDPVSKPRVVAAIAPTVAAPSRVLAETPKTASVSKPRVAAGPSLAKPAERPRLAQVPAVPAAVAQPLPRRVAALPAKAKLFIIGQPVRIMNASGNLDRVGTVSRRLSALGWTVRLAETGRTQAVTTLVYSTRNIGAAKAMQRTLPFPVRLVAETGPSGMRLVIGRDYLSWKSKNVRMHALWQKGPTVASLQTQSAKGVR